MTKGDRAAGRGDGGATGRPPWSEFRAALEESGFRPSRRLGQNFLLDENLSRALARDAGVGPLDFVLEVGAGCGFLTAHLADTGARVLAVEIDPRLAEVAERFLGDRPQVELLRADALAGKHRLAPEIEERLPRESQWSLVANLPYVISAPLLAVASELERPPVRMHVLLQKEVAERAAAAPGSSARGLLSVKLQAGYHVELGREVPAGLFWPRPKVRSVALHLDRRPDALPRELRRELDEVARTLFQRRRQGVARALGTRVGGPEAARVLLAELAIDPLRRAESLTAEELLALARSSTWRERTDGAARS